MSVSTTINIPGRDQQVVQFARMTKENVIESFAGNIDLSNMDVAEDVAEDGSVTLTFTNKTGTKGATGTRIFIQGRDPQVIPNILLNADQVREAFSGQVDLANMDCTECVEDDFKIIRFTNKTGTKGSLEDEISSAMNEEEVVNTLVAINGREDQLLSGMRLTVAAVKESFAGNIDLSSFDVSETIVGDTNEIRFVPRTGTKG